MVWYTLTAHTPVTDINDLSFYGKWKTIALIYSLMLSKLVLFQHSSLNHEDVIKWKHVPSYWPSVRGIHRSPVNSPHKGQWRRALMFSVICAFNKRLSKQWWHWWFERPSRLLWRHCNMKQITYHIINIPLIVMTARVQFPTRIHELPFWHCNDNIIWLQWYCYAR